VDYQRSDRVGDLLIKLISQLLREEIRDPRVAAVSLTGAKVSKDLRHARIYFNIVGGQTDKESVLAGMRSATGFIRSKVGRELNLRYVPALEFLYDDTEDEAERIETLLRQVKK